jgi:hypothetical protein
MGRCQKLDIILERKVILYPPFENSTTRIAITLGVGICTFYAVIVNKLNSSGMLPTKFVPSLFNHDGDVSWIQSFKERPCENSLADFHASSVLDHLLF